MKNQKLKISLELSKSDVINLSAEMEDSDSFLTDFLHRILETVHEAALTAGDIGREIDSVNPLAVWKGEA